MIWKPVSMRYKHLGNCDFLPHYSDFIYQDSEAGNRQNYEIQTIAILTFFSRNSEGEVLRIFFFLNFECLAILTFSQN